MFLSVQFSLSIASDSLRTHGLQHATLPVCHLLSELTQTHLHRVGDAIQPSHPLSSLFPPAFNLSQHQCLSNELVLRIRWPNYWSFSFSISPSNEYSGLICFRIDWFDLLPVQGILKSLLQHHCSKGSNLWCSSLFMVQVLILPQIKLNLQVSLCANYFEQKLCFSFHFSHYLLNCSGQITLQA